jgi:hypothetical protein
MGMVILWDTGAHDWASYVPGLPCSGQLSRWLMSSGVPLATQLARRAGTA